MHFLTWSSKASTDLLTFCPLNALVSKYFRPRFSASVLASFSSTCFWSSKSALLPIKTTGKEKKNSKVHSHLTYKTYAAAALELAINTMTGLVLLN